jgi:hypothetical protein
MTIEKASGSGGFFAMASKWLIAGGMTEKIHARHHS